MIHSCPCGSRRIWAILGSFVNIFLGPAMVVATFYIVASRFMGDKVFTESPLELLENMPKDAELSQLYGFYFPPAICISIVGFLTLIACLKNNLKLCKISVILNCGILIFAILMVFVVLLMSKSWIDSIPLGAAIIINSYWAWVFCEFENELYYKLNGVEKLSSSKIKNVPSVLPTTTTTTTTTTETRSEM